MEQTSTMTLRHQNLMLGLRREMGWPLFKPANDCLAFSSGRPADFEIGMELARLAQLMGKDLIYSGWEGAKSNKLAGFTLAYRELLAVDVIDNLVPYAANDVAPVVLVSTRADEFFAVDRRGSLVRMAGKPHDIGAGRKLAMKRIKAAAMTMGEAMLASNRWVPMGATVAPEAPQAETIVRFG